MASAPVVQLERPHTHSERLKIFEKTMHSFVKIVLPIIACQVYFNEHCQAELKLLNVVFRHGDRAPLTVLGKLPNNRSAIDTFFPVRPGGLNNDGKLRAFELGQYLRQKYDNFLGETYVPEMVNARSTNFDRTKMSLQLVLAGLYPPNEGVQKWNNKLNWQPIPFNYIPQLDDVLMLPDDCPKYLKAREKVEALPEIRKILDSFKDFMSFLTRKSGKRIQNLSDMSWLYQYLIAMRSMNIKLPSWTDGIYPQGELRDAAVHEYEIASYNNKLKRLNGGVMLRKIIENMNESVADPSGERKIYLYSGHETNVAALLQALGVYGNQVPNYSSAVIIELHQENDNRYFVKIVHYKGSTSMLDNDETIDEQLYVPRCPTNCSLENFVKVLNNVVPSDKDIKCDKRSVRGDLHVTGRKQLLLYYVHEEDKLRDVLH